MSKSQINFQLLEKDEGNSPFDELITEIERRYLQGDKTNMRAQLEQTLMYLERKFQDFQDADTQKSQVIYEAVKSVALFSNDKTYSLIEIYENLERVKVFSNQLIDMRDDNINSHMVFTTLKNENPRKKNVELIQIHHTFNKIFSPFTGITVQEVPKRVEWDFEFNFEVSPENRHKPLQFIHTFIEGLNHIEGVTITLEDISIGSIRARMKAVFDDVSSKEEVKELLESVKLFAKGKLEKDYYEAEKLESEAKKNSIESDILKENLIDIQSPESKEIRRLESESLRYDIERKKLENEDKKLDLFKKKKDLLKELLAEGFIEQKNFEMLINDLPFLSINNGQLLLGASIDEIDKKK